MSSAPVAAPVAALVNWFAQLLIMLKRNTILQIRYRKSTLAQSLFAPILFMVLLLVLQKLQTARDSRDIPYPLKYPLQGLKKCQAEIIGQPCVTLMYAPNDDLTRLYMTSFAKRNNDRDGGDLKVEAGEYDITKPPAKEHGIVAVPSAEHIYNYTVNFPNMTYFGVHFSSGPPNVRYQIWYNTSLSINGSDVYDIGILPLVRGLDEAILSVTNTANAVSAPAQFLTTDNPPLDRSDIDIQLKDWPKVKPTNLPDGVVSTFGAMFFFCSAMVIFISVLQNIVTEKEMKLRHAMAVMGLKDSVYWFSWLLSQMVLVIISSLVTVALGHACNFTVFRETDFGVMFFTFFLFGMAMVSLAFFITTLVRRARVAVLIGMFLFIIGLVFQSFAFSSAFVGYIWFDANTNPAFYYVLMHLPFFNFGKIFLDISSLTTGRFDVLTDTFIKGPGFNGAALNADIPDNLLPIYDNTGRKPTVPRPVVSWYLMLMNIGIYYALTWYCDKVVPDEFGNRHVPWFFLTPSFWGFKTITTENMANWLKEIARFNPTPENNPDTDDDVKKERVKVFDESLNLPVRIISLRKVYRQSWWRKTKTDKVAVKSICLGLEEGKLLALLGQNGAGKSTTMNILSGMTPPTQGDALIYGHTISSGMDQIRAMMGVCPQHDILFPDMTAEEHIELYGGLKGLSRAEIRKVIDERLEAVRLTKVKDQRAGTYSGGMKRRLSVIISTIGDPKIVFLDEPTTGMDPVNRRHVWSFLEKFKTGRIVVMTTHSMEEADILGDVIAIQAHGRLVALGNSIYLKNKFGAGYRISLTTTQTKSPVVKEIVAAQVPEANIEDDSAGSLIYQFPISAIPRIPAFVKYLETEGTKLISQWGISQTTLEEVFLKLIREANPHGYQGYENFDGEGKEKKTN